MGRSWTTLITGWALLLGSAQAQMRPNQPPTLSPPPSLAPLAHDAVGPFRARYRAAGSPRIVLFWNVSFDDTTETPKVDVTVRGAELSPVEADDGATGVAAVGVRAHTSGYFDPGSRGFGALSSRDLAELDTAFRSELLAAQTRLLDRASTIRFMQAQHDRKGIDPKLIEADAVLGKADILLQVMLVRDAASPLDIGFEISALRVKAGTEIASFYTTALPEPPPAAGRYVATDNGFVWQQTAPTIPDAGQIGRELADEVMEKLGPVLTRSSTSTP